MHYPALPPLGSHPVPALPFRPSLNRSSRRGSRPRLVFVHVWGGGSFSSVCEWLSNPSSQASAHVVYGGMLHRSGGEAAQLVPFSLKAWTEAELNPVGLSIESADAIWSGHDPHGFAQLARMVALLCHLHLGACRYVSAAGIVEGVHGFTRHGDAGALGGGHPLCPTGDLELWHQFAGRVVSEYRLGGFRDRWGT